MKKLLILPIMLISLAACSDNISSVLFEDLPSVGDAERGEEVFGKMTNRTPACSSCHTIGQENGASPDLSGFGDEAENRVDQESAREYAFYSITEPGRYLVDDYGNIMYNKYDERLSLQDIADLIEYLLTL